MSPDAKTNLSNVIKQKFPNISLDLWDSIISILLIFPLFIPFSSVGFSESLIQYLCEYYFQILTISSVLNMINKKISSMHDLW